VHHEHSKYRHRLPQAQFANARTHSTKQIRQIAESMKQFGFVVPIVIDENHIILAGHGRHAAAKLLGLTEVLVIEVHGLSAAKKRALALADNKIGENGGWDREMLAVELSELSEILIEEGLDITITGFAAVEIRPMASIRNGSTQSLSASREICGRSVITGSCAVTPGIRALSNV
jgi:ParB-like chromosome segregation protein Spo0J